MTSTYTQPWIGVDLDGTWAYYDGWKGFHHIGDPLPLMTARVVRWLEDGKKVKVFTARATTPEAIPYIQAWTQQVVGRVLEVTATKDLACLELWDDRAVQMIPNTGRSLAEEHEAERLAQSEASPKMGLQIRELS